MKRFGLVVLGMALTLPAVVRAAPPAFPPYPTAEGEAAIRDWATTETDLQASQILLVEGGAVYAAPPSPENRDENGETIRLVREEVASPALAARLRGRSSEALVRFDCAHRQSSIIRAGVFPGNNLSGGPEVTISGSAWLQAATVYLFDLAESVCGGAGHGAGGPSPTAATAPPEPISPIRERAITSAPIDAAKTPAAQPEPQARAPAPTPKAVAGVFWVQAGAYASKAAAEERWTQIDALLPKAQPPATYRLEPAPGGALTRLLVGPFGGAGPAAAACERLKAAGMACFIRR